MATDGTNKVASYEQQQPVYQQDVIQQQPVTQAQPTYSKQPETEWQHGLFDCFEGADNLCLKGMASLSSVTTYPMYLKQN